MNSPDKSDNNEGFLSENSKNSSNYFAQNNPEIKKQESNSSEQINEKTSQIQDSSDDVSKKEKLNKMLDSIISKNFNNDESPDQLSGIEFNHTFKQENCHELEIDLSSPDNVIKKKEINGKTNSQKMKKKVKSFSKNRENIAHKACTEEYERKNNQQHKQNPINLRTVNMAIEKLKREIKKIVENHINFVPKRQLSVLFYDLGFFDLIGNENYDKDVKYHQKLVNETKILEDLKLLIDESNLQDLKETLFDLIIAALIPEKFKKCNQKFHFFKDVLNENYLLNQIKCYLKSRKFEIQNRMILTIQKIDQEMRYLHPNIILSEKSKKLGTKKYDEIKLKINSDHTKLNYIEDLKSNNKIPYFEIADQIHKESLLKAQLLKSSLMKTEISAQNQCNNKIIANSFFSKMNENLKLHLPEKDENFSLKECTFSPEIHEFDPKIFLNNTYIKGYQEYIQRIKNCNSFKEYKRNLI